MKLRFWYTNTCFVEKYIGKDDLCENLAQWMKAWGEEPQLEWVHIFCHTLDTIAMNWYLEMGLHHGIVEWDILRESFLLTFSFEDGFECIDEALKEIKVAIFRTPKEPVEWAQPDWST